MSKTGSSSGSKGTSVNDGASTPIKVIKRGATTPAKPKPKPSEK